MSNRDLVLDDITQRLVMMPKGLMESIIILRHKPTKASIDSVKRWITMVDETLSEYEKASHSLEGC